MLTVYVAGEGRLRPIEAESLDAPDIAWVDLFEPSAQEEAAVEQVLGVAVPSREEMAEIEISSWLYIEGGAAFMTAILPSATDSDELQLAPVTFVLTQERLINIEQNAIIKIFSVAAVVFLPPTLIASIYGMNFDVMPELSWPMGYLFALALMAISAVLPFWFFKWRGWL